MCTALTIATSNGYHLFGRSLDSSHNFNLTVHFIPRNYIWKNVITNKTNNIKYAILGMGIISDGHPLIADGFNEKGLACAALNFPDYASYNKDLINGKINIGPYDLILWILSNCEKVSEVKNALKNINIVNIPFSKSTPIPLIHWLVYDKDDNCIVIEKTKGKLKVYDNKIGVLTNSPTFDWQITNLRQYINLTSTQPEEVMWHNQQLTPLSNGIGLTGFPGDFSSVSRFIRAAYLKIHVDVGDDELSGVTTLFKVLDNTAMIYGSVITSKNLKFKTFYKSSMCLEKGIYYYNTYNNNQVTAISMFNEDLDTANIKVFPYRNTQSIYSEN